MSAATVAFDAPSPERPLPHGLPAEFIGAQAPAADFDSDDALLPELKPEFEPEVGDFRLRALMSEAHWSSLPAAVRRRFSKRLAGTRSVVYSGEILETTMSWRGWLLAQAARLIGAPLPTARIARVPSVVTV